MKRHIYKSNAHSINKIEKMSLALPGLITVFTLLSVFSVASAVMQIDAEGQLTGATDVEVGGLTYNVTFTDGTCISLYAGCDNNNDFEFKSRDAVRIAGDALRKRVFQGGAAARRFASHPSLTRGCTNPAECRITTPYGLSPVSDDVLTGMVLITTLSIDSGSANDTLPRDLDTEKIPERVFAIWTPKPSDSKAQFRTPLMFLILLGLVSISAWVFIKKRNNV